MSFLELKRIDDNKMKWIEIFFDTIYKHYCKGNNKVYQWELQRELKFLNYLKLCGEYHGRDADRLNSIKNLYLHIKNGTI
jgi:hypothetical protein